MKNTGPVVVAAIEEKIGAGDRRRERNPYESLTLRRGRISGELIRH